MTIMLTHSQPKAATGSCCNSPLLIRNTHPSSGCCGAPLLSAEGRARGTNVTALKFIRSLCLCIAGSFAIACVAAIAHHDGRLQIVAILAWACWCSLREVRDR